MELKLIIISVACVSSIMAPVDSTGILGAKIAVAKKATLLGAGALAMKGVALKGTGALLSAKGSALKNAAALMADIGKEVTFESQTEKEKPATEPCSSTELLPPFPIEPVEQKPVFAQYPIHTVQVESVPLDYPIRTVHVERISPKFPIRTVHINTADGVPCQFPTRTVHINTAGSVPCQFPIHTVQVETAPPEIHEHLKNKLSGVWSTIQKAIVNKTNAVGDLVHALKTPSVTKPHHVYKYVTAPKHYVVPIIKHIKV